MDPLIKQTEPLPVKSSVITTWMLRILILLTLIISISAAAYFISTGDSMLYRDAKSHLNISRRVFYSQTPGLAQLGGVWLPFAHILMMFTVWNDFMYYSGLAGIIPNMIAFILLIILTFLLIKHITKNYYAAWIGSLLLLTNPSLLYLQSTPMTEVIVLATITGSIYFLAKWLTTQKIGYLIGSALFVFMATLTRYDGWFVFVCEIAAVALVSLLHKQNRSRSDGYTFIFTFLGGFGIALWLIYSKLIFGNFLNFALGKGTGAWDAQRVAGTSEVSSKYDLVHSFLTFTWLSIENAGMLIFIASLTGFLWFILSYLKQFRVLIIISLLITPYLFNIISLFLGLSVAYTEHLPPFQSYNLRYGTAILPFAAVFIGFIASRGVIGKILATLVIIIQAYMFYTQPLVILADANVGNLPGETKVAHWVREHPISGNTLLSTLSHDPLLFEARIPMNKLIYEGNQHLWTGALSFPEGHADRIILKSYDTFNDEVNRRLGKSPALATHYNKVYDDGDYKVYDRKSPIPK